MTSPHRFAPALLLFALATSGCSIEVVDDDEGTLTVEWTLDDSFDPDACFDFESRSLELVLYDRRDDVLDRIDARCEDFTLSIDLPEGNYGFDATLLDRSGRSVTTTLALEDIDVFEGEETFIEIDFPIDSIR